MRSVDLIIALRYDPETPIKKEKFSALAATGRRVLAGMGRRGLGGGAGIFFGFGRFLLNPGRSNVYNEHLGSGPWTAGSNNDPGTDQFFGFKTNKNRELVKPDLGDPVLGRTGNLLGKRVGTEALI